VTQQEINELITESCKNTPPGYEALPRCPFCGERYSGDGKKPCSECVVESKRIGGAP